MEIKVKQPLYTEDQKIDLVQYIIEQLDGDDYDRGALESARATANNAGLLLGKLINVLVAKKILTENDLSKLFGEEIEIREER